MTAAQEVGWDADTLFDAHKPKYAFNRQTQAECQYANNYILTFHRNPHTINTKVQQMAEPAKKWNLFTSLHVLKCQQLNLTDEIKGTYRFISN